MLSCRSCQGCPALFVSINVTMVAGIRRDSGCGCSIPSMPWPHRLEDGAKASDDNSRVHTWVLHGMYTYLLLRRQTQPSLKALSNAPLKACCSSTKDTPIRALAMADSCMQKESPASQASRSSADLQSQPWIHNTTKANDSNRPSMTSPRMDPLPSLQ